MTRGRPHSNRGRATPPPATPPPAHAPARPQCPGHAAPLRPRRERQGRAAAVDFARERAAAVDFARERGARAIEGHPMIRKDVLLEELHVGTERTFADAGFMVVSRPTLRRLVMRIDF
jgi:hypothetical protein